VQSIGSDAVARLRVPRKTIAHESGTPPGPASAKDARGHLMPDEHAAQLRSLAV
jgi:hypothetical protein